MKNSTGVKFRAYNPDNPPEVGFLFKSWKGSFKSHLPTIPHSMYPALMQGLIERIIDRSGCQVVMVVHPSDPDFFFGFAVIEKGTPTIHYMYVKADYRRKGIGTDLLAFLNLDGSSFNYTHSTPLGRKFFGSRGGTHNRQFVRQELPS